LIEYDLEVIKMSDKKVTDVGLCDAVSLAHANQLPLTEIVKLVTSCIKSAIAISK